jgi:hypothetical protein
MIPETVGVFLIKLAREFIAFRNEVDIALLRSAMRKPQWPPSIH